MHDIVPRSSELNRPRKRRGSNRSVAGDETPLAYMLRIINDPHVDYTRRDKLAIAAAPYCHARMAERNVYGR